MVVLDTNIIIDHLRSRPESVSLLDKIIESLPAHQLALSIISIQEVYTGESTKDAKAEEFLFATISPLPILPYTLEIARRAGELTRDHTRILTFADSAIAATTLVHTYPLYTLNTKAFAGIPD